MQRDELNPFLLAANVPEPDPRLLPLLRSKPEIASKQDSHGYSLLHAAASYNHINLLRSLIQEFKVDVNLVDEDNETCLFVAETVEVARCLVEELRIDTSICNDDGLTATERITADEEHPELAQYLTNLTTDSASTTNATDIVNSSDAAGVPPRLPPHMNISINTMNDLNNVTDQIPDPDFRRRIEELASRENFSSEEGQRELRELITDAVRGVGHEERDVRRRTN